MKQQVSILLLILSLSFSTYAYDISAILPILKLVESMGDVDSIGDNGKAYGILQIHKICIDDVNRIYGTSYVHKDAFDEEISNEIFRLYIEYGAKRFKKRYNKSPTEEDIVRMWNGGCYTGYKKESTISYYNKYEKYKKIYQRKFRCRNWK